jgi:hypothetical protein
VEVDVITLVGAAGAVVELDDLYNYSTFVTLTPVSPSSD